MMPRSPTLVQFVKAQNTVPQLFTDAAELLDYLQLPKSLLGKAEAAARLFPLRVPKGFVELMIKGDLNDPLLRQVLPLGEELLENEGFSHDPVGDLNALGGHGVINKYHGRSLLITTGACVIHCRYCFRRHFPYDAHNALRTDWREAIEALKAQPVEEVILSGGDPLALSNRRLAALLNVLTEIEGLKRIRIHSRYPIVLPERVDHGLLKILARCPKQCVMVVHSNHTQELGGEARQAIARLNDTDCRLYNQTVLLKGVNDRAETLIGLCETLFELGVQPYYLHQLDRVCGAAHFEVPKHEAALIYGRLMEQLPGYMVPKWVEEVAGATHKLPIHLINTV